MNSWTPHICTTQTSLFLYLSICCMPHVHTRTGLHVKDEPPEILGPVRLIRWQERSPDINGWWIIPTKSYYKGSYYTIVIIIIQFIQVYCLVHKWHMNNHPKSPIIYWIVFLSQNQSSTNREIEHCSNGFVQKGLSNPKIQWFMIKYISCCHLTQTQIVCCFSMTWNRLCVPRSFQICHLSSFFDGR